MFFKISSIILYIFRLCASDSTYECGVHGKFEYCIDGIPGCVIGCHCHPGYYFDTDTKICEPNIKLTQDYRRHYLSGEPTRVYLEPMITSPPGDIAVESTTKTLIDQKVDDIAKDADDLGDWLYNQFFKTIENQVINKTNGENLMTRRSSGNNNLKKPIRRSHKKHYRSRSKKPKRGKKNNLKNKLLRITEDDSLFDSSSSETDTDDDDDDKSSHSSGSSTSGESEDNSRGSRKKKGHGHKKIVIFNKKPRPPLPSFIFLPNMDTPFFPPIGLPPPAVPMYPMVPVPPVMGPIYPYPVMPTDGTNGNHGTNGPHDNNDKHETTVSTTTEAKVPITDKTVASTTVSTTVSTTREPQVPTEDMDPEGPPENEASEAPAEVPGEDASPAALRQRRIKRPMRTRPKGYKGHQQNSPRNKLLQKLRQKMMRKNKLENYIAEQYQDGPHLMDLPPDFEPGSEQMKLNIIEKPPSPQPDVDFKYLTELIHRIDTNDTTKSNLVSTLAANELPPHRRYFNPNQQYTLYQNAQNNTRKLPQKADDSFYSNLGRQIASMIKNIDLTGQREIDVQIEQHPNKGSPIQHVFNENDGYGSRSYWERSVRSPLKYISEFKKDPNYSNEHLFKLENQVEYAASTERTLSLLELESIISGIKKTRGRSSYRRPQINYTKVNEHMRSPSKISFDLNLISKTENVFTEPKTIPTTKLPTFWKKENMKIDIGSGLNSFLLSNYHRPLQIKETNVSQKETTSTGITLLQNVKPTRQPNTLPEVTIKPSKIWYQPTYIQNLNSNVPSQTKNINQQNYRLSPLTPVILKHQSVKSNNKNQFILEKMTIPVHLQHFVSNRLPIRFDPYVKKKNKPSYFYNEFHHLDYFDDNKK